VAIVLGAGLAALLHHRAVQADGPATTIPPKSGSPLGKPGREFDIPGIIDSLAALTIQADGKGGATAVAKGPFEIEVNADVPYYEGPDADGIRHKLDLYIPKGGKEVPVLLFFHGGSWTRGDKFYSGIIRNLGLFCASHGILAVIPNYRLSPAVMHPEHIRDVARAFAWAHKNATKYGGRPDRMFLSGHSAGGHLASLLATDENYLKSEGLCLRDIKGVIPLSGVFQIPNEAHIFENVFPPDSRVRHEASPLWQVCHRAVSATTTAFPPFLIMFADQDFAMCHKSPAEEFCKALQERKVSAKTLEVRSRNHLTLLLNAPRKDDPAGRAMLEFITALTK
jgi:acetyl esterase/lipase